jgi:RHS repeat-associated protein
MGNTFTSSYNALGQIIATTDALGRVTRMVYDENGRLIETILPDSTPNDFTDNPRTKTQYDAMGRSLAQTDAASRTTRMVYDADGRVIEIILPDATPNDLSDNPRTKTEYYSDGLVKANIDELGHRIEYRYDALGRRIATIYADSTPNDLSDNPIERTVYNAVGQVTQVIDALGRVTKLVYDDLGRLITTKFADGTETNTQYDALNRRIVAIDQNGNQTKYKYDSISRLVEVKDALLNSNTYSYDELSRLLSMTDAEGRITRYEYDDLGRRVATILPLGQRDLNTYDAVGNLITATDFNGNTATYTYDEQNRQIRKSFPIDGTFFEYTYTLTGNVSTITSVRGVRSFVYDERDRLIARRDNSAPYDAEGYTIEYQYDAVGNRTNVKTASGMTKYSFDERNRLKTVTDSNLNATTYFYDKVNNLTNTQFANGVLETREYDLLNHLKSIKNIKQDSTTGVNTVLTWYDYLLDSAGQRLSVTDYTGQKTEYSYDSLYRLNQEKVTQNNNVTRINSYTFDRVGNRLSQIETVGGIATTTTYQYDLNDRLAWEKVNDIVSASYQYDLNGNTIQKTEATQTTNYQWNQQKQLIGVTTSDGTIISYAYDCSGVRQSATVNSVKTRYVVDQNLPYAQVIEEWTNGSPVVSYVYGNDLISQKRGGSTLTYLVDGLGSTTALTDENGNLTDRYTYDAYGKLTQTAGTTSNNYLFAGEQWDSNLEQYYLRQRYYDPQIGRFTRMDTHEGILSNPLSLNKYIYAHDNPVLNTDPSGLFLAEQTTAISLHTQLLVTAYAFHFTGTLVPLVDNPAQEETMNKPRYRPYKPFIRRLGYGCFGADVPRGFTKKYEDASIESGDDLIVPDWWYYEYKVSRSWTAFFLMTSLGTAYDFDGRTPNTRDVWEAKLRYNYVVNHPTIPQSTNAILSWEGSRFRGNLVSTACGYNFKWAFSNADLASRYQGQWAGFPPVYHIPE